ncbi:MAG: ParB/RepB/Spo0J family partition protein [Prochlorotrichaceae cyanobacterium]
MSKRTKLEPITLNTGTARGTGALFGDDADYESAAELVDLEEIVLPAHQPRRYFSQEAMENLISSIQEHGILSPLLVRPTKNNKLELVAGERRYRAATILQLEQVPVVKRNLTDTEALEFALLENLAREDLNPVEETESILELLSRKLGKSQDQVTKLFSQTANEQRETAHNVMRTPEWEMIEAVFSTIGRFTASSFRANRLPLLKLPEDILEVLRTGQIEYTKAKEIAKIKDEGQRQDLLKTVIAEKQSLQQIRAAIKALQAKPKNKKLKSSELQQRTTKIFSEVKKAKIWSDDEKQTKLKKILQQLEDLLQA